MDEITSTQGTTAPETTTSTPATGVESSQETASSSTPVSANDGAQVVEPQVPAYTPNFKFKVMGKEHEIPEHFRSVIKDADTEKMAREIFEKAYGIDQVKSERARVQEELKNYRGQTEPLLKLAQEYDYYLRKGDMGSAFQVLGISKQDVWKWALKEAELQELNPEQRRVYDQQSEAVRQQYQLEQQNRAYQEQLQQFQVQSRQSELQSVMSRPDVSHIVQAFDQRNGPGSFQNEVILRGQYYWATQGRDVPAEHIVQELVGKIGGFIQPQQAMTANQATPTTTPQKPPVVPVLPNTGSGAVSPAKRKITSIQDIEREYQEIR